LPNYNRPIRIRWNNKVNAPIISKRDSEFKGMTINEENVLKVIAHDYKINPGIYMTPDEIREDIGGSRSEIKNMIESLESKNLVVTHKDKNRKVALVKASYDGLQKAFPKEHYQWFPNWYEDSDKF
jgi:DNA-binding MarR family transcriptional regulator